MKKTNKKGFTIVELVIVIAVIAILAAVLIPTFAGVVERAKESSAITASRNAYTELMAYTNATLEATTYNFSAGTIGTAETVYDDLKAIATETGVNQAVVTGSGSTLQIVFTTKDSITVTYKVTPETGHSNWEVTAGL